MNNVIDYFEKLRQRVDCDDWIKFEISDASSMREARLNVWNSLILSKKNHCFYFNEEGNRKHG